MIHELASVDPTARIAEGAEIGPWTYVGPNVEIAQGTWIGPHVTIARNTRIGRDNKIYQYASIGEDPQDKKYAGEETYLEIGDRNIIRESCTIHRGTVQDNSLTKIGSDNLIMAYVHIAHDSVIGNHTIFTSYCSIAGHVIVEDFAILGGYCAVHQFCRVGTHSFLTKAALMSKDSCPFTIVCGSEGDVHGINVVGLKRRGFSEQTIRAIREAYKIIFRKGFLVEEALKELNSLELEYPEVQLMADALRKTERGIAR